MTILASVANGPRLAAGDADVHAILFTRARQIEALRIVSVLLIAEFVADFNTDRARASIKALIGAAPRTATLREASGERVVPVEQVTHGAIVLVRAGESIPVDGTVVRGAAAVSEASITGESVPIERGIDASVLAGTLVESGAIDVRTAVVSELPV